MASASMLDKKATEMTPYFISNCFVTRHKTWIVLPAYNEEGNLGALLERIHEVMIMKNTRYEIVVVDDGSSDQTALIARSFQPLLPVTVLTHPHNQGLGVTVRDGFNFVAQNASPRDIVVCMDADNTHNPGLIPRMEESIQEGSDVVIASRYQTGSVVIGVSSFRQFLSLGASGLFRLCFPVPGVRDYTCGYRAYRSELIQKAFQTYGAKFINQTGFECMIDILLKLRKLNAVFREVPLVLRYDLKLGESKMKVVRTVFKSLTLIFKHRAVPGFAN